jgi:hypothetical protein
MSESDYVPTRIEILAAQALVKAGRRLGWEVSPEVLHDAEWPLEKAAPYPEDMRGR